MDENPLLVPTQSEPNTSNDELSVAVGEDPSMVGSNLEWSNLSFVVPSKDQPILKPLSGCAPSGRLLSIMGPSGAGKSTMLNVLSGRVGGQGVVEGKVLYNSVEVEPKKFRSKIAYVMQEDALFATQTPTEALEFSAALRLPAKIGAVERSQLVAEMLEELGLTKCKDTFIGSVTLRGISGGEKKRTAIGVELISQPKILFLDEPTSGLDSYAAYNVVQLLQRLAQYGVTIVCTIHQPSSEVFALFDDTLLLADGRLVYHGAVKGMPDYFSTIGYQCGDNHNPADFVMFLMQEDLDWSSQTATEAAVPGNGSVESLQQHARHLAECWGNRAHDQIHTPKASKDEPAGRGSRGGRRHTESAYMNQLQKLTAIRGPRASSLVQAAWLAQREMRKITRDKVALIAQIVITITLNLIIGLVFKGAGKWDSSNCGTDPQSVRFLSESVQNHFGALTQVSIGAMFGLAQPALLQFPLERPVFLRERATGVYASWPYFVSKLLCEIPLALMQTSLLWGVVYFLIGFQGDYVFLVLATTLLGVVAASSSIIVGSLASNVQTAIQATPLVFVPQLLFSGFFISINKIPSFMRWSQYLCSLKYAINLLLIVEFKDVPDAFKGNKLCETEYNLAIFGHVNGSDGSCEVDGDSLCNSALFPRSDVTVENKWLYVGILLGIFVVFRVASAIILTRRARG